MMRSLCACHPTRRGFLTGLLAAGAAGCAAPGAGLAGQRIDIHHHAFSPAYVTELDKANLAPPIVKNWTLARTLDDMAAAGVATAMLSVTTPQVSFTDAANARRIARECNEYAARLAQDHRGRFGSFAMLPMQDADGALRELEYALDVLKADGIGLLTSYGDKWLGHPQFDPVIDELNRRKAVLYTHPTAANCCRSLQSDIPPTVIEFGTDTSRAITQIVFSGTAARCPDVTFVFSHAGGTLPFLTERLLKMPVLDPSLAPRVPHGVLHELQRFYYDTAWSAHPMALASLTRLVKPSQIVFGSDYPYRTGIDHVKGLADYGFSGIELRAIERDNALRLLPRWRNA
ncbi:MAG TPA: amidohydrolase family protein [Burkholderiaceae bacterium]|nr:amidohydrolase family protein [Burkholderiaceae bacterium]